MCVSGSRTGTARSGLGELLPSSGLRGQQQAALQEQRGAEPRASQPGGAAPGGQELAGSLVVNTELALCPWASSLWLFLRVPRCPPQY